MFTKAFHRFASQVAHASGKPVTFLASVALVVVWALTGPTFRYSDTWQLVINTGTTIITFLMVFLIQSTQNRDSAAIQAKLDELIRASAAQNRFIGVETLTEEELVQLRSDDGTKAARIDSIRTAADEAEAAANRRATRAADRISGLG